MTTVRPIVPTGSTELERAVDTTFPRGWAALADGAQPTATAANAALLPWLAQQWQVAQFENYFADPRALLDAALPWLRERGSAAAVRRALAWIGYTSVALEEDGARLHINPGREVSNADIARMAHVVRASIPLHVAFYRVFYRLDMRLLRWDTRPAWDAALWDNYSGTPVDLGDASAPIIASQARYIQSRAAAPRLAPLHAATHRRIATRLRRADTPRLDAWRWDGPTQRLLAAGQWWHCPAVLPTHPRQAPQGNAVPVSAAVATQALGAPTAASHLHTATGASARLAPARQWRGRWDANPWRAPSIRSKTTETME